jgi:hypothetical protein
VEDAARLERVQGGGFEIWGVEQCDVALWRYFGILRKPSLGFVKRKGDTVHDANMRAPGVESKWGSLLL